MLVTLLIFISKHPPFSKARDIEAKVLKLGKQLEEAQNYVQRLNKKQYEG